MEDLKDVVSLLLQLFPGFIAAWILYGFSSYPKPSQFERLAQALVFSFLVRVLLIPERSILLWVGTFRSFGIWDDDSQLLAATLTGIVIGLIGSYFAYNDKLYAGARRLGLTTRTAYPSEWFGALTREARYIVLHLNDGRRIYGWPQQWPSAPAAGHFELVESKWLQDAAVDDRSARDGSQNAASTATVVDSILVPAADVVMVEILKFLEELDDGTETRDTVAAPAASRER
jgi:hypothetical protein